MDRDALREPGPRFEQVRTTSERSDLVKSALIRRIVTFKPLFVISQISRVRHAGGEFDLRPFGFAEDLEGENGKG